MGKKYKPSTAKARKMDIKNTAILLLVLIWLVGLAVFAALLATGTEVRFDFLKPTIPQNPSCTFPMGFACMQYGLHSDGSLDLKVWHATGHTLRVEGIACVPKGAPEPSSYTRIGVEMLSGVPKAVSGRDATATVRCGSGGNVGEISEWTIYIKYSEVDTGMQRKLVGALVAGYE